MPEINPEDIQLFIYSRGEVRTRDLEKEFVESGKISRATLYNWKKNLEKEGEITAKPDRHIKRFLTYVPEKHHRKLEVLKQRRGLQTDLNGLSPQDAIKTIKHLRAELKSLRREYRINKLEEMPLPLKTVVEKLLELGFEKDELGPSADKIRYGVSSQPFYNQFDTEGIEMKLTPASEFEKTEISLLTTSGRIWRLLNITPIKGVYILAAYKENLRLNREKFEEDLLKWKKEYGLSKEEWQELGPGVREMLEAGRIPLEIDNFLVVKILSKTPEGRKRLNDFQLKINIHPLSREEAMKYLNLARNGKR